MTIKQGILILFKSTFLALMIVGMSLMFIFIHDVLTQCDYFKAVRISVEGGQRLTPDQILETAGIEKGINLVSLNLKTVRERLLAHPWIAQADIRRTFPGDIAIRIQEQTPLAVLDFGKKFLINSDGVIFKEALDLEMSGLPIISGIVYSDWRTSETPETPVFSSVLEVLRLGRSPEGSLPNTLIRKINVDREIGLTFETDGPVKTVKLGYGDYRKKYSRLEKILAYIEQDENIAFIEEIDLRNPDRIVARPGNEELSDTDKKEA